MYLIAGLGNPTREHCGTRHNIGFDVITAISDKYNIRLTEKKFKGLIGGGYINGEKVLLLQPQTYMNASGESIAPLAGYYKIPVENILVIYDDIALDVGKIRVRAKGSAGGHNGMKSIIEVLSTNEFPRVRVGVGAKPEGWDLANYVLGRFKKEEEPVIRDAIQEAVRAVEIFISQGIEAAMNDCNSKKQ